ncbi:hypothetical protein DXG01_011290 [Tephrocybe rancida]|nr:hypothetical protein DXG01_011290 [Tephrocybe rancida]
MVVIGRSLTETHPPVLDKHIAIRLTVCKQNTDFDHEYAVVTFEDREGRLGYLRLERDIGELAQTEGWCLKQKSSKEARASDLAKWSRTLRKLPQDDELLYYNLTDTGNDPPLLYHVLAMGAAVSDNYELYRLLNQNCYLFTSIVMLLTQRQFNVEFRDEQGSAQRKGRWRGIQILPHSIVLLHDISDVDDTYQKCVKAIDDLVSVMNKFLTIIQTRLTSLTHQILATREREEHRQQQQSEQQQELIKSKQQNEELQERMKHLEEQLNELQLAGGA